MSSNTGTVEDLIDLDRANRLADGLLTGVQARIYLLQEEAGLSREEIAAVLGTDRSTVDEHVGRISKKLTQLENTERALLGERDSTHWKSNNIKKVTGSIEHWVTTFNSGFWGLTEKYRNQWENIKEGEVHLLHGAAPNEEVLDQISTTELNKFRGGVIGIGIVSDATQTKDRAVWLAELQAEAEGQTDTDWPLLINYERIFWFGDTENIRDVPVEDKTQAEVFNGAKKLAENAMTFSEMRDEYGYSIPAQGSISGLTEPDKLLSGLRLREDGWTVKTYETDSGSEPPLPGTTTQSRIRDRSSSGDDDRELTPISRGSAGGERGTVTTERARRSNEFRRKVRQAYENRCAVCGSKRVSPESGNPEVEGSHIQAVEDGGPDKISNGLALCRLHHWAFDQGWIAITDDYEVLVKHAPDTDGYRTFEALRGQDLANLPDNEEFHPDPTFLERHRSKHGFEN